MAVAGLPVDAGLFLPGSVGGLAALVQAVRVQIDAWGAIDGLGRVLLIHQRRTGEVAAVPHMRQLLPWSPERLRNLSARPWPSRRLPTFTMEARRLLAAIIRQHLWSSVYRAAAESLASEHPRPASTRSRKRSSNSAMSARERRKIQSPSCGNPGMPGRPPARR
jgi:F-type H+-transporting ATPase subunit gamma